MAFRLWATLGSFFSNPSGPITGNTWTIAHGTNGGDPIYMASATPTSTFQPGQQATYDIDITAQNWLGDEQPSTLTVATTTLVNPFRGGLGGLGIAPTFSYSSGVSTGAAVWWQASATPGAYDLKFETFTDTIANVPTSTPALTLSGSVVTLRTGVKSLLEWDINWNSNTFVYGYSTAATATTENIYFRAYDTSGKATSPLVRVATNVSDDTRWYVANGNGTFAYAYTKLAGANTGYYVSNFNTTTGALGSPIFVPETGFTRFDGVGGKGLPDGSLLLILDGVENGQHVFAIDKLNSSLVSQGRVATIQLSSGNPEHYDFSSVYDPNTGYYDYTVLGYEDGGHVHLRLFDQNGASIGSDFIVPDLTSFDSIHTLGTRVEIDYRAVEPNGDTDIRGYIYDTATGPYIYTANGGEWVGTPFNDTVTDGGGANAVNGGGGSDKFIVNYSAAQVSESIDPNGDVLISTPNSSDRLQRFATIALSDANVSIKGNVLTQKDLQGHLQEVSTYNVSGKPYTAYSKFYNAAGSVSSTAYYVERDVAYSGSFSVPIKTTTVLDGGNLTLTGPATFNGGTISGTNTIVTQGSTSLTNLTITGAVTWTNAGVVTERGSGLSFGIASGATLNNLAGATYALAADVGISLIPPSTSTIVNAGLLQKTAGSGTSVVAPAIANSGTIAALRGTLDLQGPVTGTGNLKIANGATLELDGAVGSGQTITFASARTTLLLKDAFDFQGLVTGFAATDKIDLANLAPSGATVGYAANADNSGGVLTVMNGSDQLSLFLGGQYAASGFKVGADASGSGTLLTYTAPASSAQAMLGVAHA